MKDRLIFFEGLDKTGKTYLSRKARFESMHSLALYDRGFVGRRVFQQFRNEPLSVLNNWIRIENKLMNADIYAIVWLKADLITIVNRHFNAGELMEFTAADLRKQESLYEIQIKARKSLGVPVLELDTVALNVEQCVDQILRWTGVRK